MSKLHKTRTLSKTETDESAEAIATPRELHPPRSALYAKKTLSALRLYSEMMDHDSELVAKEMAEIQRHRHWEVLGYPSREAMLAAELSETGLRNVQQVPATTAEEPVAPPAPAPEPTAGAVEPGKLTTPGFKWNPGSIMGVFKAKAWNVQNTVRTLPNVICRMLMHKHPDGTPFWARVEFENGETHFHKTVADWVGSPKLSGLGMTLKYLFHLLDAHDDLKVRGSADKARQLLAANGISVTTAAMLGARVANSRLGGRPKKGSNLLPLPKSSLSPARLASRLKRDHPDFAARLEAGEFPSIRAAAIAAGILKPKTPLDQLRHWWRKAPPADRGAFLAELDGNATAAPQVRASVTAAAGGVRIRKHFDYLTPFGAAANDDELQEILALKYPKACSMLGTHADYFAGVAEEIKENGLWRLVGSKSFAEFYASSLRETVDEATATLERVKALGQPGEVDL